MIRLLLADDQALVRGALAALLDLEPDLTVVAEVGGGTRWWPRPRTRAGRRAAGRRDARARRDRRHRRTAGRRTGLPGAGGDHLRPARVPAPGDGGGRAGFVVKDTPAAQLADAVRRVHSGLRVVDPTLAAETLVAGTSPLTGRESDVLRSARDGGTVADIARALHLSEGTVRNHLSAAIGKTGARTRAEAVRIAVDNGWL